MFRRNQRLFISLMVILTGVFFLTGCSPAAEPVVDEAADLDSTFTDFYSTGDAAGLPEDLAQAGALDSPSGQDLDQPPAPSQVESLGLAVTAGDQPDDLSNDLALNSAPAASAGASGEPAQPQAQESASEPAAVPAGVDASIGSAAPDFSLQTLDGQQVSLSALQGKNVLLNYWVTWCIPCLEEMPALEKLGQEFLDEGLVILSINGIQQDDLDKVKATIGEYSLTFPVALDQGAMVYDTYRVQFMPTSFFIDEGGVIRHIQLGSTTEDGFRTKIEQLISDQL